MVGKISQTQKDRYCYVIYFFMESERDEFIEQRLGRMVVVRGEGGGGRNRKNVSQRVLTSTYKMCIV